MMSLNLSASRVSFALLLQTSMDLETFPGNVIRSAIGGKLRRLVCVTGMQSCAGCALRAECAYPQLFEASFTSSEEQATRIRDAPKPYIIHFSETPRRHWQRGETFTFEMILVGPALTFLPHLVYAIQEVGRTGMGAGWKRGKGRFNLVSVESISKGRREVHLGSNNKLVSLPKRSGLETLLGDEECRGGGGSLHVEFVTPLRLRKNRQWVWADQLRISQMVEGLIRRVELLSMVYGSKVSMEKADLLKACDQVRITKRRLNWQSQERYSSRTKKVMPMDGIVGTMQFEGPWERLYPLLKVGELLHLGKGSTMGMGQYRLKVF